jgi:hypothetical protein
MLMMAPSFWHVSHHRKAVLTPFTATAEKCGQPECKRNGSDNAAQGAEVVIVVCSTPTEVLSHIIAMVEGWTPPQLHVSQRPGCVNICDCFLVAPLPRAACSLTSRSLPFWLTAIDSLYKGGGLHEMSGTSSMHVALEHLRVYNTHIARLDQL